MDEETQTATMQMPKEIATAIVEVMGGIKKIAKDAKNQHGGYMFVSVDDFLEEVRPLCAKAGLVILQDEEDVATSTSTSGKTGAATTWLKIKYAFTLVHASGKTAGPMHKTGIALMNMGPQAFGACQSYALKNFMRSLFQIGTGDLDIDDLDAKEGNEFVDPPKEKPGGTLRKAASNSLSIDAKAGPGKLPPLWKGPTSPADLEVRMNLLLDDLPALDERDMLLSAINEVQADLNQCAVDLPKLWAVVEPALDKQKERVGL